MQSYAEALATFDEVGLREILCKRKDFESEQGTLLHDVIKSTPRKRMLRWCQRRQVMYMLRNAGLDVNTQDNDGNSVLHLTLLHWDGDPDICEPLLQAGADTQLCNESGESAEDLLFNLPGIPKATQDLFKKYSPGLWYAVERDDLMCVRKLVNLWCRGDLKKNGKTMRQLTFEKGTEHIIRLIKDIEPSTLLAHAVLAGDTETVQRLCEAQDVTVNVEFRNRGDMGATPLFYAIMQNNAAMIELLMTKGTKINTTITFQDEDIPIYFAALNKESEPDVIKLLTPPRNVAFLDLQYRGNNVLFHCIENEVHPYAVRHILQQGYPELVAARNQQNLCGRELAERMGQQAYVNIIDEVVHDWYLDTDNQHRKIMALLGYPYMREARKDGVRVWEVMDSMETSSDQAKFDTQLTAYQNQVQQLMKAIDAGDVAAVKSLVYYNGANPECFHTCLAEARGLSDEQPPLIKAVLRSDLAVTAVLAETLAVRARRRLDAQRDAWYRTALHYACAMQGSRHAVNLLTQLGASEFTLDKDERSPLVFKDYQEIAEMHQLIRYHIKQDYSQPEPDPWQHKQKIRIAQCQNHSHNHQQQPQQQPPPPTATTAAAATKQDEQPTQNSFCTVL